MGEQKSVKTYRIDTAPTNDDCRPGSTTKQRTMSQFTGQDIVLCRFICQNALNHPNKCKFLIPNSHLFRNFAVAYNKHQSKQT